MQFTWRTERIRGLVFPGDGEAGSWVAAALLSIIPKQFEAHTGFTPGMMLGPLSREPYSGNFLVKHRFSCTYDLGCGLSSPSGGQPLRRFHLPLLPDRQFRVRLRGYRPGRSYMELGVGVVQFLSLFAALGFPKFMLSEIKRCASFRTFPTKCVFLHGHI